MVTVYGVRLVVIPKSIVKLSISNIAWPLHEEEYFLSLIKEYGCSGVEIAANKIWTEPIETSREERKKYKKFVNRHGLEILALQSILYTRRDLGLFKGKEIEVKTISYLKDLCHVAADIGAKVLVFGSPANRTLNGFPVDKAFEHAAEFFYQIGAEAIKCDIFMCIEPLSRLYTDFVNTVLEGIHLVELVGSKGFGLHLDSAALYDEGSDVVSALKKSKQFLRHFHVSEPELVEIDTSGTVDHRTAGAVLREIGYDGYVSIEMRLQEKYEKAVKNSLVKARRYYFGQ